jgi:type I restriction enzyme S subunit
VDRRVRRLVRAKRKLIALLTEQKQAIIHRAVTRGLDPDVPLKDSGVEWLGEVPAHWEVRRLRNVAAMRVSNVDKHVKEGERPVRLCNYVDVYKNDHINQRINFMRATATHQEAERFKLEKDDVLITKDSEAWDDIGVPALVTEPADDLISGYHLALLRPFAERLTGGFLLRALQSKGLAYQFHVEARGVTRYGLSHAGIKSTCMPLPPLPEQAAIVDYLDQTTADIDAAITRASSEIDLLTEYRTRLTADVVTGKLDVREAAAALPEVDPLAADDEPDALDVEPDSELDELAGVEVEAS